ncbi:MAG TPA: hypothetical protein DG753_00655 [Clostridium sp.]|nr:hypothetical protein [Clostridium sp.]
MKKMLCGLTFVCLGMLSLSSFTPSAFAISVCNESKDYTKVTNLEVSGWFQDSDYAFKNIGWENCDAWYREDPRGSLMVETNDRNNPRLFYVKSNDNLVATTGENTGTFYYRRGNKTIQPLNYNDVPGKLKRNITVENKSPNTCYVSISEWEKSPVYQREEMPPGRWQLFPREYYTSILTTYYIMSISPNNNTTGEKNYLVRAGNDVIIGEDRIPREKDGSGSFPELNF